MFRSSISGYQMLRRNNSGGGGNPLSTPLEDTQGKGIGLAVAGDRTLTRQTFGLIQQII